MRSQSLRPLSLLVGLLGLASAASPSPPPTFTFFVASDSHFGARGMSELNREVVRQMNDLPGAEYPAEIGGRVDTPRGVLFTGDTTDNGHLEEFAEFEAVYGLTGRDGLLRYPVFEAYGNHDLNSESPVKERVRQRHGSAHYAWDWGDVRFICLDLYPDAATRPWLTKELDRLGARRPVILFFHYSIEGYYSDFWEEEEKEAFAMAIEGHNVLAVFHGHEHGMGHYIWRDHPVFRPGAPRHRSHQFLVVRLEPARMAVAAWDYDRKAFVRSWTIPVRR